MSQQIVNRSGKSSTTKPTSTAKSERNAPKAAKRKDVTPEVRNELIAVVAYYRAEKRGFVPGQELEDWLEAEREIDRQLSGDESMH